MAAGEGEGADSASTPQSITGAGHNHSSSNEASSPASPATAPSGALAGTDGRRGNGVVVNGVVQWFLGIEGGRESAAPRSPAGAVARLLSPPGAGGDGANGSVDNSNVGSAATTTTGSPPSSSSSSAVSRLDFASKPTAHAIFRADWEARHGAAAAKEMFLDSAVPAEGPTWTRAEPVPFKVLRVAAGAPISPASPPPSA